MTEQSLVVWLASSSQRYIYY